MSKFEDISLQENQSERNNDDQTGSSSCHFNADSQLLLSSTSSQQTPSQETSFTDNNYGLTSMTSNVSIKSTFDNKDPNNNRVSDDNNKQISVITELADEQSFLHASLSNHDAQDWKCRECGFINKYSYNACDTCETSKPIHPLLEKHLSYTRRSPSSSPSNTRSPSPEEETMYNRTNSQSPLRSSRKSYSSHSSDDNEYTSSRNTKKQSRSSLSSSQERLPSHESVFSFGRDRNRQEDDSKSDNKKIPSAIYSSDHRSYKYQNSSDRFHSELQSSSPPSDYYSCIAPLREETVHHQHDSEREKSLNNKTDIDDSSIIEQDKYQIKISNESVTSKEQNQSHSSFPKEDNRKDSYLSSYPDSDHQSTQTTTKERQVSQNPSSSKILTQDNPIVVYVPDLPVNIHNNQTLENMIRDCLKLRHKQEILNVKCYTQLGIGIIYLHNEEDKTHIIKTIGTTVLERSSNTMISFTDELELISYVVIDTKDMNHLPSTKDICQRWVQLYKIYSEPKCEQLSVHFPNIFRIITYSLDELINSMLIKELQINKQFAAVYFRADCCFFENLPRTTNLDRLKEAISQKISNEYMSKELIHIQYNKDSANAVVITSDKARIWSLHNSILLDKQSFMKKDKLACRLIIRSVPKSISLDVIKNHPIFAKSVIATLPSSEHVILELNDGKVYEDCINRGALRIGDHSLTIDVYTFSSNPEDSEIDGETWYNTEMCDYKPDITPFMSNLQHPIFRLKWNSQAFSEQINRWKSNNRHIKKEDQNDYEKQCNIQRHLLRMTVMLNTIGVIKKGFYRINEKEIKLKSDRLQTILYNHKSKLEYSQTISLSNATKFPYSSTIVKVVNTDCLIVYKDLVKQGYRPVILNMANATNPGGGYKRGDGAQEETLFRRSNYYQSLDITLDDGKPTTRFYCNSNCILEPLTECNRLYPMEKFGAIYTSGLIVFRQPEETGYAFMEIPMYDVCAIAMAAYRDPKLINKNLLSPKYSIGTRKKIENIFSIAHHHKHDCLVLSALGCGAFRNPPEHIAKIFQSVIEQYAGYFQCIYFAIIDDHNAGHDLNPLGNYQPFRKLLDNLNIKPKQEKLVDMMIGPWRILNQTINKEIKLSDIRICYLIPCYYGGKCEDIKNERHCQEYSHPPLCPYEDNIISCKEKHDDQHMLWFRHRQKCSYRGECTLIENDRAHANEFEHPIFCRDGGKCENMESDHLKSYRHVPLCRFRRECVDFNRGTFDHCQQFRHCIPMCRFGTYCIKFYDEKHFNEEKHPFQRPCPFTPFHCRHYTTLSESRNTKSLPIDVQNHCLKYSHVCRFGRQCHDKSDIHWKNTIHIARQICSYGDQCTKKHEEDHLNSFSHPGIADIRRLCKYHGYDCRERQNPKHIIKYRHNRNHNSTGIISCFGLNQKTNFINNQENIIKAIKDYTKHTSMIPLEVQEFVKNLQPIHRCGKVIFESILVHGHVMSSEHMEHLKKPQFVAQAVQEHKGIRAIFDHYKKRANIDHEKIQATETHAKEFIRAIVSLEYSKKGSESLAIESDFRVSPTTSAARPSYEDENTIHLKERILRGILGRDQIETIRKYAINIAQASWNLHNTPTGIHYQSDKLLGTDKHVFGILGPHLGHYDGDIFLVFKSEIMLHPDANFSPQAATSFVSQKTFTHRPWIRDPGSESERIRCFHESKLHCSIPGYEYAAAAELMAITGLEKKTMNVNVKSILKRWKQVDSHEVFEAHLPRLVPLDYIEEIYIPKNLFASLTPGAQVLAKKIFRESLHITHHEVNLNGMDSGGIPRLGTRRSSYQDFVVDKLIEKFQKGMERTRCLHGTVVTLAPSQFADHIVLPLRINDSYNQYYQIHKHKCNSDDIYIYWQAMYGDMMITLSDEQINLNQRQSHIQCLVCYIAERPSTTTTDYHQSCSYIYAGDPYGHDLFTADKRRSGISHTFHRGCNVEDFLTYCLKLEKKTGEVTLSHAGPNSIYCYETISCNFSKTTLNLNELNYIHVSAGSQKVPIQNLIISFEPITDLHPSFDKNFKYADDAFPQNKKPNASNRKSSPETKTSSEEKSPSIVRKVINAVDDFIGYDGDDKKLEPCPDSINCPLHESSKHMKEKSHPCRYSELCRHKNDEPYLTHEPHHVEQCPSKNSCQKLNDPFHRAKHRHPDYPDFLIPCRYGKNCYDKTWNHRIKYSHGEQVQIAKDKTHGVSHTPSSVKSSSNYQEKVSDDAGKYNQRTSCRYGSECRDQGNTQHCSKYSHPPRENELKSSANSNYARTPCRYGRDCRDQGDTQHCLKYSHSSCEHESKFSISSNSDRTPCRYGHDCRDKNDFRHCSKYSHPDNQQNRDDRIPCKFGQKCYDFAPSHRSKYSHFNK